MATTTLASLIAEVVETSQKKTFDEVRPVFACFVRAQQHSTSWILARLQGGGLLPAFVACKVGQRAS